MNEEKLKFTFFSQFRELAIYLTSQDQDNPDEEIVEKITLEVFKQRHSDFTWNLDDEGEVCLSLKG
jgi:hypothetical protein